MSQELDPFDPEVDRILNAYARQVEDTVAAPTVHTGTSRSTRTARARVRPWLARGAASAIALLVGGAAAVAAATGGLAPFGWPVLQGTQAPPGTPLPALATSMVGGDPEPGWVFVVDEADVSQPASVVLVDSSVGRPVSRFATGPDAEIAINSDATVLFVAESDGAAPRIRAIDTRSGLEVFTVPFPARMMHTLPPVRSGLALSFDNRWLFAATLTIEAPGRDLVELAALDTLSRTWAEPVPLDGCISPWLVAQQSGVIAACPHDGRIFTINATDLGPAVVRTDTGTTALPAVALDGAGLVTVSDQGYLRQIQGANQVELTADAVDSGQMIWQGGLVRISSGTIVASRDSLEQQGAIQLTLVDDSGDRLASRTFDDPLWSIAGQGDELVATSEGSLIVLDQQLNPTKSIRVGTFLAQPLVVP